LKEGASVVIGVLASPGEGAKGALLIQPGGAPLTPQDAEAIARECPAIALVAPVVRVRAQVHHGERSWVPVFFHGTTPAYLEARVRASESAEDARRQVAELLRQRHRIGAGRPDDFRISEAK